MRTNNVSAAIHVPSFANLHLYDGGYKVTVSLNISQAVYQHEIMAGRGSHVFSYKGKYYIHWYKSYKYDVSFGKAYCDAANALNELMITIRQDKIVLLQMEIEGLEYCGTEYHGCPDET